MTILLHKLYLVRDHEGGGVKIPEILSMWFMDVPSGFLGLNFKVTESVVWEDIDTLGASGGPLTINSCTTISWPYLLLTIHVYFPASCFNTRVI